jgi:dTDP-4-dehydrorhamnose reductase
MKTKIFLIGARGLLGSNIVQSDSKKYSFFEGYNKTLGNFNKSNSIKIDITKFEDCKKILKINPDIIIHTAAITDVDYCEQNKKKTYSVHVLGTKNLCKIAKKLNCKIIYISTDGIFSGNRTNYKEDDVTKPLNYYGKTKLEAENEIKKLDNHLILRTNVLYGFESNTSIKSRSNYTKPMNFVLWVLNKLNQNQQIKIVNDQFSNPTLVDNLVSIIYDCIQKNLTGIYHATDLTCINRYEFTKKIAKIFGYDENLITSISSNDLNQFAKRPLYTCLDCSKIIETGIKLHQVDSSLNRLYEQIKKSEPTLISNSKNMF